MNLIVVPEFSIAAKCRIGKVPNLARFKQDRKEIMDKFIEREQEECEELGVAINQA